MGPYFYLKNHGSQAILQGLPPWEFQAKPLPPFKDKDGFRRWCLHSATDHYFYTPYEALNPGVRVSKENASIRMYGVVADYDSPMIDEDWEGLKERGSADFPPAHGSLTFSNNVRLVWLFAEPVFVYQAAAHEAFLKRLAKELKLKKLLPGFDEEAFLNPAITFELGHDWRPLNPDATVPKASLDAWLFEAGKKGRWANGSEIVVPIDKVRVEVEARYPGKWPGDFAEGVRGPRFWDMTADNPTAAVVREAGMQCFTGDQPFVTWREILGHRFVEEFQEDRVSKATGDAFFDGRHYWLSVADGWKPHAKEDVILHMKVACRLNTDKDRGESSSEVDQALYHIQRNGRIDHALPLVHQQEGISFRHAEKILNTSTCRVIAPLDNGGEHLAWGEKFPFIGAFLAGFLTTPEQDERFLAWLKRLYQSSYEKDIAKGQTPFFAGPVQTGKTLLSNKLVGEMLGGYMDATEYLLGKTSFNSSLYSVPIWCVDDSTPGSDAKVHAQFSANVKKMTANQSFEFLAKFRDAALIRWLGRPIVTLNDDAESMRILPDADTNILDKVMLFRVADRKFKFPPKADTFIKAELPAFGRWLLDWDIPERCLGDNRFGVVAYHEPSLLDEARRAGRSGDFRELLSIFRSQYFQINEKDKYWEGTATALVQAMSLDDGLSEILRSQRLTATNVGRELSKLQTRGYSVKSRISNGHKLWRLDREDGFKE